MASSPTLPGPRQPLGVAGCRVDDIVLWVPQVGRVSLGVSLFRFAGTGTVGVAVDPAVQSGLSVEEGSS